MDRPTCSQLRTKLKEIKELKAEFDLELSKIKDTRDTAFALGLEKEIREKICLIDGPFFCLMSTAEKILEKDMLGPEAIESAFGFKPEARDISLIPFSKAELERAKELEQFLILRVDKTPDGHPLTMKKMNKLKGGKTSDRGKILYSNDDTGKIESYTWYKNEQFFITDTPSLGWALVSKEVIPDSTNKKYLEQTEVMISYVKDSVFKGKTMPLEYQEAINEFKQAKEGIKEFMSFDETAAAEKLASLKINQLFRQTPVEVLYDILLMKEKTGEYILSKKYTQTNRRSSGKLVNIGVARKEGLDIERSQTHFSFYTIGVSFSRRG